MRDSQPAQQQPHLRDRWIAEPLYGKNLRKALAIDKRTTEELNRAQLEAVKSARGTRQD